MLLGLSRGTRGGEGGGGLAGRMWCFCSRGEGVPPVLSSMNRAEWRNCRVSSEWHRSSLFSESLRCHPSHSIPAFYGLKRRVGKKEGENEKEEEKWRFIFSPVYQMYPECATGRVWLPGNQPCYSDRRKCSETSQLSRSLQESLKSHGPPLTLWKLHSMNALASSAGFL